MKKILLSSFLLSIMMVSLVSAFGVSSPYWNDNPLQMARGEVKTVDLNVQNMVGDEDVRVIAEIKEGSDISSLGKTDFIVKAGTSNTIIPLRIEFPEDTTPGESKKVKIEFKTTSPGEGISVGTGMLIAFDVVAKDEVAKDNRTSMILILSVIVLLIVLTIFLIRRKRLS